MKVLIAGGGIGGLAAALSLHAVGIEADVFEQAREIRARLPQVEQCAERQRQKRTEDMIKAGLAMLAAACSHHARS